MPRRSEWDDLDEVLDDVDSSSAVRAVEWVLGLRAQDLFVAVALTLSTILFCYAPKPPSQVKLLLFPKTAKPHELPACVHLILTQSAASQVCERMRSTGPPGPRNKLHLTDVAMESISRVYANSV